MKHFECNFKTKEVGGVQIKQHSSFPIPGFFIPFIYIPDLTEDQGMSKQQGAVLISIIGILNTVSRVLVGWTADRSWADALVLNNVALVIGGLATMFVPYYANFGVMATYSVVFGSTIGKLQY